MKTFKTLIIVGAVALTSLVAQATGYLRSCQVTNYIQGNVQINNWPTNQPIGTNPAVMGVTISTGLGVAIGNFEHIGIDIKGTAVITNGASANLTIGFIPSMAANTPQFVFATNQLSALGTNLVYQDWATPAQYPEFMVNVPFIAATANTYQTNVFDFETNLVLDTGAQSSFPDANWIGVYTISNNLGAGAWITNLAVGVNTKLIPTPLISQ